jgi:hypothetical protein
MQIRLRMRSDGIETFEADDTGRAAGTLGVQRRGRASLPRRIA